MKKIFYFWILLGSFVLRAALLTSAPGVDFRVFPGNWNTRCAKDKNLSKLIRSGFDPATGKSDGRLTDGDPRRSAVAYNYHGIPVKQRVLNIEVDLGRLCTVDSVSLNAMRNNSLYDVKKVLFYGSADGFSWRLLGECSNETLKLKNFLYTAFLKGNFPEVRFVRFAVYAGDTWLNVTEIAVNGSAVEKNILPPVQIVRELTVTPVSPDKIRVLFLKMRIALDEGEEVGRHLFKLDFNGDLKPFLLNRKDEFIDSQSGKKLPLQDVSGRYLVRADADDIPFNAPAGHPYSDTLKLNRAFSAELANRFYNYTFRLDGKGGNIRFAADVPDETVLRIDEFAIREVPEKFFYSRNWMQAVMPDTFPALPEIESVPGFQIAGNETGLTGCPFYTFSPVEGRLELTMPGGKAELFEVRNTPVEYSRKFAAENAVPNLGEAILPEWWVPENGKLRSFPAGSTALAIRFTPDKTTKPGKYQGELRLLDKEGKVIASQVIDYEILPFDLPEYSELPAAFGLYIMGSGTANAGDNFWYDLRDHGITLTFMTPWGTPVKMALDKEQKLTADFTRFNDRLKEFHRFDINRRMVFFGTSEPLIAQIKKITGQNPGEAEFDRRFKEFIALFAANTRSLGIPVRLSLYDEANFKPADWQKTVILTKLAKSVPGSQLWITSTTNGAAYAMYKEIGYRRGEDMVLTHPSKLLEQDDASFQNAVDKKNFVTTGEVKKFHLRAEYNDVFAFPGENARYDFGLRTYRSDLEVFFAFAYWWGKLNKPNFTPTRRHYISIPFPVEPGGKLATASGWEAVRCGIDDYRYLIMAQEVLSKSKGAEAARKELETLIKADSPRPDLFTPGHYDFVRKKLIDIIKGSTK